MSYKWQVLFLTLSALWLMAGEQPWKDKQIAQWSEDDARQVLSNSPWAKTVTPTVDERRDREGGGLGQLGRTIGLGIPGIGIGMPGSNPGGGYPGGGYPGGGDPGGGYPGGGTGPNGRGSNTDRRPPELTLRWESALPVREAEMKAHETDAPSIDDVSQYAIAVYGLSDHDAARDSISALKRRAVLRLDGKNIKPSSVLVMQRENGPVVVYQFPKKKAIAQTDKQVEFEAQIGGLKFSEDFVPEEMIYQGKLEM